ncbi:MAG: hypothetical protein R6T87_03895 [Marinobacter sp.]
MFAILEPDKTLDPENIDQLSFISQPAQTNKAAQLVQKPGWLGRDWGRDDAGLDPVTAAEIDNLILHINKTLGTTIIIVTHDLESIFAVGQRAIMLDKGSKNIVAQGTPADMRDNNPNPTVRRFFSRKPADNLQEGN